MNKFLTVLKSLGSLKTASTAIAIAAGTAVFSQVAQEGIDATPLIVLPPMVKLAISVAAPVIAAYLKRSPRETNEKEQNASSAPSPKRYK